MKMTSDWFYEPITRELRLGDIVEGYTWVAPHLQTSSDNAAEGIGELASIDVVREPYAAVLTPCCSIEGDALVVGPLRHVRPAWFANRYVSEDFVRIDERIRPEQAIPQAEWEEMSSSEKAEEMASGPRLAFVEYFAFPSGNILPRYPVTYRNEEHSVDFYVVDFRHPMLVHHKLPRSEGHACGEKILQLSSQARDLLRNKIANYYSRQLVQGATSAQSPKTVIVAQQVCPAVSGGSSGSVPEATAPRVLRPATGEPDPTRAGD